MRATAAARSFRYGVIAFWSVIVVFPLFWLVTGAFKQQHDIFPNATYIPWVEFEPTLRAFRTVFTEYRSQTINAFTNSLVAAITSGGGGDRPRRARRLCAHPLPLPGW